MSTAKKKPSIAWTADDETRARPGAREPFAVIGHVLIAHAGRTTRGRVELECRECRGRFSLDLQRPVASTWDLECEACVVLAKQLKLKPPSLGELRAKIRAGGAS